MGWFKQLFCKHEWKFLRNIYGDEINACNGNRSWWVCKKCGKLELRPELYNIPLMETLDRLHDEFYNNLYEQWKKNNLESLNNITNRLINCAKNGDCWCTFLFICDDTKNDKYYYEKWFNENKLKVEWEEYGPEFEDKKLKQYKFKIRWSYKW